MERPLIWLLTIKHTGTHYTFECLANLGLEKGRFNVEQGRIDDEADFMQLHVEEPHGAFVYPSGRHIMTTMRNPCHVFRSYGRRYDMTIAQMENAVISAFALWEKMVEWYDPFVFRVDAADREMELRRLAEWLGVAVDEYVDVDPDTSDMINSRRYRVFEEPAPPSVRALAMKYNYLH